MSNEKQPVRRVSARTAGAAMLADMINGVSLVAIAKREDVTLKRAEWIVRGELRRRWIAPLQDYARLQIARLEAVLERLKAKSEGGDLPTVDRVLKVLDRLDRYHGFTKLAPLANAAREDMRERLLDELEKAGRKPARDK